MPDEVESMMSDRLPWHGKGVVVDEAQTAYDALVLAGLDWEVELLPCFAGDAAGIGDAYEVPNRVVVGRRMGPDKFEPFEVVSDRYRAFQNREVFSVCDTIVGDEGGPNYKTAGSLHGGRRVFMTLKFPQDVLVAGVEPVELYLVAALGHDGGMSLTFMNTPIVVVCANTLNLALHQATVKWTVRHTEGGEAKIAAARDALGISFAYHKAFELEMGAFAEAPVPKAKFEEMVRQVFPGKTAGSFTPEQYALIGVLESSPQINDDLRYTAWGALNAVREYDDWGRQHRGDSDAHLDAVLFGRNVKRSDATYQWLRGEVADSVGLPR